MCNTRYETSPNNVGPRFRVKAPSRLHIRIETNDAGRRLSRECSNKVSGSAEGSVGACRCRHPLVALSRKTVGVVKCVPARLNCGRYGPSLIQPLFRSFLFHSTFADMETNKMTSTDM
jgi:hypothetical protein